MLQLSLAKTREQQEEIDLNNNVEVLSNHSWSDDSLYDADWCPPLKDLKDTEIDEEFSETIVSSFSNSASEEASMQGVIIDGEVPVPGNEPEAFMETRDGMEGKRPKGAENWKRNKTKKKRMTGEAYVAKKKVDGQYVEVERKEQELGPRGCNRRCEMAVATQCSKLSEQMRETLFRSFWKEMTWEQKKTYVVGLVERKPVAERKTTAGVSRGNFSYVYYINSDKGKLRVCKNLFLSTFGIGEASVYKWMENIDATTGILKSSKKLGLPRSSTSTAAVRLQVTHQDIEV